MRYETVKGGLRVEKLAGGWAVLHEESQLPAVQYLRQRRFAEQARDELLATEVDFTMHKTVIQLSASHWKDVAFLWRARTHAQGEKLLDLDPVTFEYYPDSTRYGQFIPSAAQAEEMRKLAGTLRARGRVREGMADVPETRRYIAEFKRMGLVVRDGDELIWTGAKT
jgi:hypothetical protein